MASRGSSRSRRRASGIGLSCKWRKWMTFCRSPILLLTRGGRQCRARELHRAVSGLLCACIEPPMRRTRGADLDRPDFRGWMPLHLAAANGFEEIVQLLLNSGVQKEPRNDNGHRPLDVARLCKEFAGVWKPCSLTPDRAEGREARWKVSRLSKGSQRQRFGRESSTRLNARRFWRLPSEGRAGRTGLHLVRLGTQ